MKTLKPGRKATPEEILKADAGVRELLSVITQLNIPAAAKYIRQNPPSAETIAFLAYRAYELFYRARQQQSGRGLRKSLSQRIRDEGIKSYPEAKAKAKWLIDLYKNDVDGEKKMIQLIYKANKRTQK